MKLLIHSHTSTVQLLKFVEKYGWNQFESSHIKAHELCTYSLECTLCTFVIWNCNVVITSLPQTVILLVTSGHFMWIIFQQPKQYHCVFYSLLSLTLTVWGKVPWPLGASPVYTLQWSHYEPDGVSNHQPHDCLLNRLFRRRWKKTSELCVTGLCEGNSRWPVNSPPKGLRASNAENVSNWWRHHDEGPELCACRNSAGIATTKKRVFFQVSMAVFIVRGQYSKKNLVHFDRQEGFI